MLTSNDMIHIASMMEGYRISDSDVNDGDANTSYNGFVDSRGRWYIMEQVVDGTAQTYRYIKGDSGYTTAWDGRQALDYDYYDQVFK